MDKWPCFLWHKEGSMRWESAGHLGQRHKSSPVVCVPPCVWPLRGHSIDSQMAHTRITAHCSPRYFCCHLVSPKSHKPVTYSQVTGVKVGMCPVRLLEKSCTLLTKLWRSDLYVIFNCIQKLFQQNRNMSYCSQLLYLVICFSLTAGRNVLQIDASFQNDF